MHDFNMQVLEFSFLLLLTILDDTSSNSTNLWNILVYNSYSLLRNNPRYKDRTNVVLEDIPFVQAILAEK